MPSTKRPTFTSAWLSPCVTFVKTSHFLVFVNSFFHLEIAGTGTMGPLQDLTHPALAHVAPSYTQHRTYRLHLALALFELSPYLAVQHSAQPPTL